ncbi:hypothetical protein CsSME_00040468 [Camellia sinensis var. sinensis]|uniref:Uncharacterized protein n=1 Tax=Camellia sinensis var. sinensis TaxID=542762 RepID=A0A4S4CVW1_CAMSN|nr:hypothetical protein TEA_020438 [Camellia sinensis var. sinensis]
MIYPEEMGPNMMHVEDFLENGLPLLVEDIQERVENASSNICEIEDLRDQPIAASGIKKSSSSVSLNSANLLSLARYKPTITSKLLTFRSTEVHFALPSNDCVVLSKILAQPYNHNSIDLSNSPSLMKVSP